MNKPYVLNGRRLQYMGRYPFWLAEFDRLAILFDLDDFLMFKHGLERYVEPYFREKQAAYAAAGIRIGFVSFPIEPYLVEQLNYVIEHTGSLRRVLPVIQSWLELHFPEDRKCLPRQ